MGRLLISVIVIGLLLSSIGCTTPSTVESPKGSDVNPTETTPALPAQKDTSTQTQTISPPPSEIKARVVRVIDGDTIEVNIQGYLYTVRYIGIDTPETVHPTIGEEPYGKEASAKNRELVEGKVVGLEKDISETDKYGRLLRYVYINDVFINAELVRLGYAQVSTYPPDVKYQDLFLQLQREAMEEGRGLWGIEEASETPSSTVTPEETTETLTPSPTQSDTVNVEITLIFYDGVVPRVESDEYVKITNLGTEGVDLAGWVLKDVDEGYPSFTFPTYILQSGKSIRVYTNEIHTEYGGFSFGSEQAVWSNSSPDIAALFDVQGQEASRKSY